MSVELCALLEPHKAAIQEAGKGLLAGNREAVTKSLVGLAIGVASSSPTLGVLGAEAVAKLFGNTATRRLDQALAAAEAEEKRQAFIRDIAAAIEVLLGEFLAQLVRVQHNVKEELLAELRGGPELADYRQQVARGLAEIAVHVERMDVSEGALGIEVSASGRSAFVGMMFVRGRGSVGLKI